MNSPIINPSIFYWVSVLSHVKGLLLACFIISITAFLLFVCGVIWNHNSDEEESYNYHYLKLYKKLSKVSFSVLVICGLLYIFIPSRETSIEMLIAKYVTYENTQLTVEAIKEAVNYIIQAFSTIK